MERMNYLARFALIIACNCCLALSSPANAVKWELLPGTGRYGVYALESDGERLYAATEESIYYSRDDGDTWRQSSFKHNDAEELTTSPGVV